ncbi:MAG: rhodanese-like domain-containing protein [Candidatus Binatia bacterium]
MPKSLKDFVAEAKNRVREVGVEEAAKQIESDASILVLDVREPGEYTERRIRGALNVPRGMLEAKADRDYPGREPRLQDRRQPIIVHCASGARSAMAAAVLQEMGFENVRSLAGGIVEWEKAGKPLERS